VTQGIKGLQRLLSLSLRYKLDVGIIHRSVYALVSQVSTIVESVEIVGREFQFARYF
jgi:hypothetical protein